jgi:type II secretory pathway pseudopilin PulG
VEQSQSFIADLPDARRGQSLIEIMVAVTIGSLMIIAAASVIAPALSINTQANRAQAGAALGKELMDNVSVWAEGDWHRLAGLATTSASHYYLIATVSPFASSSGDEAITVSTTTYKRYFRVSDACRDASGGTLTPAPCGGGTPNSDPSTKQITIGYSWIGAATTTISEYLTRANNSIFMQTDWSGGQNQAGPVTSSNSLFASSTANVNYSSSSGSIYLNL